MILCPGHNNKLKINSCACRAVIILVVMGGGQPLSEPDCGTNAQRSKAHAAVNCRQFLNALLKTLSVNKPIWWRGSVLCTLIWMEPEQGRLRLPTFSQSRGRPELPIASFSRQAVKSNLGRRLRFIVVFSAC